MRVSKQQAEENRRRIVETAGALFREKGLNGIGVADLMKQVGLTHGGFYGHFASKDDLAAEACASTLAGSAARWERVAERSPADAYTRILGFYLSATHRDSPADGCPIPALAVDAGRQGGVVRRAFTEGLRPFVATLSRLLPGGAERVRRERALAALAGLVGAVILSRAVDDPDLSDEILAATAAVLGTEAAKGATEPAGR